MICCRGSIKLTEEAVIDAINYASSICAREGIHLTAIEIDEHAYDLLAKFSKKYEVALPFDNMEEVYVHTSAHKVRVMKA